MRFRSDLWKGPDAVCWLCLLMEHFVGVNSLEHAPALLSGMDSIGESAAMQKARLAIFNFRQLKSGFTTRQSLQHAVAAYRDFHAANQSVGPYTIDPEALTFSRVDAFPTQEMTQAIQLLSAPLPYQTHGRSIADPARTMQVPLGKDPQSARVTIPSISAPIPGRRTHTLSRRPAGPIRVTMEDLRQIAVEMDAREALAPERRPGNWETRLRRVGLLLPDAGTGLMEGDAITLEGLKHLIGLPGAGKTTLLMLLGVWFGRMGYKTMLVFPSIDVSRQYLGTLHFHGVKVGMLVGQSTETRRRHAERVAETIAAEAGMGGFGATVDGASAFGQTCVLPAFASDNAELCAISFAPCEDILQANPKKRSTKIPVHLCPLWSACGRNEAPRSLIEADVWVGHVLSMDTKVPAHAIDETLNYFELIARTFDVAIFDEADMVQDTLDGYGTALYAISGAHDSVHSQSIDQVSRILARGENHWLHNRTIQSSSRDHAEFGIHNEALINAVQMLPPAVSERFESHLLTTSRMIGEILEGFSSHGSRRDTLPEEELTRQFARRRAITGLWDDAAYAAFYDRSGTGTPPWPRTEIAAAKLELPVGEVERVWGALVRLFRRYLAENLAQKQSEIQQEIVTTFVGVCFPDGEVPMGCRDAAALLISVTFMILGYQRAVPASRTLAAEGLLRDPIVKGTVSKEMQRLLPRNILGSLSGVRYSFTKATSTRIGARNVTLSYVSFVGAPRMLMHRFHRLAAAEGQERGPAVLLTSATSFLEDSPAYHIECGPDYVLKAQGEKAYAESNYTFRPIWDPERDGVPLRYSGAGELANRNLLLMVDALARGGRETSEIYKAIRDFDVRDGIYRKAALVVNSYEQAREIKRYLDRHHREVGSRTKAVVSRLEEGEKPTDYVTSSQAEALGDDDTCDIVIFPMAAIGRGVNIVFTRGPRVRQAAIGTIYFLTRPHPSTEDLQLLNSLAGRATQQFNVRRFGATEDLATMAEAWVTARNDIFRLAHRLLQEPLMASKLGSELFRPFVANQMVSILQTIGRGMRDACLVSIYFVDAAWAPQSAMDQPDSPRNSMLVQMVAILKDCIEHPDPVRRAIYAELFTPFYESLRRTRNVVFPESLAVQEDGLYAPDAFDEAYAHLDM